MAIDQKPVIAVTSGEPAGVGPELCATLLEKRYPARLVVLGDKQLIAERAKAVGNQLAITDYRPDALPAEGGLEVLHLPLATSSRPGQLDKANGGYVLRLLDRALAG